MLSKTDYAVVTEKALKSGKIGFAYRDKVGGAKDSGWRMMHDKNEDPYDLINPDKLYACDLKRLIRHFPEIQSFIKSKPFTVVALSGDQYECVMDKNLSSVPNRMAGKKKYVVFSGAGPGHGGSAIFTADPVDERTFGEKEWEKLLP